MSVLALIDAQSLYWRSYHGLKTKLSTDNGVPTWAVHGTVNSIAAVIRRYEPTHVLVAFDRGKSIYRRSLYPLYKAQRPEKHAEEHDFAVSQLGTTETLLKLFGLHVHSEEGIEADDIIATAVKRWKSDVTQIVIVSGDKDFKQLCSDNVSLMRPSLGGKTGKVEEEWDEPRIWETYGVPPQRLADVWALTGDVSDNVPGVPGIGEKTAIKLIQTYGDAAEVAISEEKKVQGHAQEIRLARQLIVLNGLLAECPFELEDLLWSPTEWREESDIIGILNDLELSSIKERWRSGGLWDDAPPVGRKLRLKAEAWDREFG